MGEIKKHNFKKLIIWQESLELCDQIYLFTESLPSKEKFNLVLQMEKCAVSIPSNIAEGSGKRTDLHFAEFLTTSLTSCYELETQLIICQRRNYGNKNVLEKLINSVTLLQSKIYSFREKINKGKSA
jgi:four helix bundle protein